MSDSSPATQSSTANLSSKGEIKVWLTTTGLNVGLFMIAGLLLLRRHTPAPTRTPVQIPG